MQRGLWPQGSQVQIPSLTFLKSSIRGLLFSEFSVDYSRSYARNFSSCFLKVGVTDNRIPPIHAFAAMSGYFCRH